MNRASTGPTSHIPALTSLRAVAALLVFLYHFPPWGYGRLPDIVISQGHVGVTVFFVLSGFLITLRYYQPFAQGEHGLADYFVRRAARILPLYYVVLTLTHVFTRGFVPLDMAHLPEWTLTPGLFDPSPSHITVPTAWSLTVEECFYASAPLLFLAVAKLRRRLGAVGGTALALTGAVALFHLAGTAILWSTAAFGSDVPAFLSDEVLLRSYTIFGRFFDFAAGAAAALCFASGRVEAVWRRPGGAVLSSLVGLAAAGLLVVAQAGMVRDVNDAPALWRWNLVVGVASAVGVLALTCSQAPLSRALSLRPLVYLGRISYALYLIQLTPLGRGLLLQLLPGDDAVHFLLLYLGMNLVSALLFELVEEPARETLLALWRGRSWRALPLARTRFARAVSLGVLLSALAGQHFAWTLVPVAPVDEARVVSLLPDASPAIVRAHVESRARDGSEPRVRLPPSWLVGPASDRRAPAALLVFVDGRAVPFLGARGPESAAAVAYYRRPRAGLLSLQIERESAAVTIVNYTPALKLALARERFLEAPLRVLGLPIALAAGAWLWWRRQAAVWAPTPALAVAVSLSTLWLVCGGHLQPWGPLALLIELALLTWMRFGAR